LEEQIQSVELGRLREEIVAEERRKADQEQEN
jgi:hypothetical protein